MYAVSKTPSLAGLRRSAFTCVELPVTLRDRIWQVSFNSFETGFSWKAIAFWA